MAKKRPSKNMPDGIRMLVRNKRVSHDYTIHDTIEAGISLLGSEVKSLRDARGSVVDGFVEFRRGEAWLLGVQINEYPWANQYNHEPFRERKLLLHAHEIAKLATKVQQRGYSLVPTAFYLKNGRIKVELALASGKRQYDKRQAAREATDKRETDRAIRNRGRGE